MALGVHVVHNLINTSKCQFNSSTLVNIIRNLTYKSIKDIYLTKDVEGSKAEVKGWVKAVRKMKGNVFIDVDDGSCPTRLQVVVPKENVPENLAYGSSVQTTGKLVLNPQNQVELVPDKISVVGSCTVIDGFPFAPRKLYPPEYLRQFLHFRPRTKSFSSLLRVRNCAIQSLDKFFAESGFCKIDVPVLTSNDCEGAGEVFFVIPDNQHLIREMSSPGTVPEEAFFNSKAYLSVSGQFHLEVVARAMNKVYCYGPTFRAENSKSRLHLSEFYMVEAEMAFTRSLEDVLSVIERMLKSVSQQLIDVCADDINCYLKSGDQPNNLNIQQILSSSFTVDTYDNVCDILEQHRSRLKVPFKRGDPLSKEHELFIVEHNNNVPFFVVDWPAKLKPFYMKGHHLDDSKVLAVDLLCPNVGELCGGSLREDHYDSLKAKLKHNKLDDKLAWYLELRKFGNVPTGGFGMGFERFLQLILGIDNIKDAIPFPRYPHNCRL